MKAEYKFDEVAVGSDGEGFFHNPVSKSYVPVVGLLGGAKGDPVACDGGGYLEDCVAWEINPEPATRSQGEVAFAANITKCLNEIRRRGTELELEVDISPAVLFKKADLSSPQASVSGCSTSYCAWDLRRHPAADLSLTNYRFASGDIHVSWPNLDDDKDPYFRINMVRMLDLFIGLSEVAHTPKNKRMEFYGVAGVHRPTIYGVEYKTPSNFWLKNEERMKWVFRQVMRAYDQLTNGEYHHDKLIFDSHKAEIVAARNKWDSKTARMYLSHYGVEDLPE